MTSPATPDERIRESVAEVLPGLLLSALRRLVPSPAGMEGEPRLLTDRERLAELVLDAKKPWRQMTFDELAAYITRLESTPPTASPSASGGLSTTEEGTPINLMTALKRSLSEEIDWREAIDGAVESFRKGDLSEWELHLITRRVEAALSSISGKDTQPSEHSASAVTGEISWDRIVAATRKYMEASGRDPDALISVGEHGVSLPAWLFETDAIRAALQAALKGREG